MRAEVLMMAAELLGVAAEHYREAMPPAGGTAPASAPPVVGAVASKPPTPNEAAQPAVVH